MDERATPSLRVAHSLTPTFTHTHKRDLPTPTSPYLATEVVFLSETKSQAASGHLRITLRVLYKRVTQSHLLN